jgi:hypothetical protein
VGWEMKHIPGKTILKKIGKKTSQTWKERIYNTDPTERRGNKIQ